MYKICRANRDLRAYAILKGVYIKDVADAIGISKPTMLQRLTKDPINQEWKEEFIATVDKLALDDGANLDYSIFHK